MGKDLSDDFIPKMHIHLHKEGIDKWRVEATGPVSGSWTRNGASKDKEAMGDEGMRLVGVWAIMGGVIMFITSNHEEGKFLIGHLAPGEGCGQEVDPDVIYIVAFADFFCNEQFKILRGFEGGGGG